MLNKPFSLLVFTILLTMQTIPTQAQLKQEKEVAQAVEQLTQAMLKADSAILTKLAHSKLSYGHSSGKLESKDEFVQTITSGASVFEEIQLTDQSIDIIDNTAIVRHVFNAKTNDPGKGPATIKIGIVLTWVKVKNQWLLLARQAFKLP